MTRVKEIRIYWEGGGWTPVDYSNREDLDEWIKQIKQVGFMPKKYDKSH